MSRGSLGETSMVFGGDDRPFQQAATRVERGMRDISEQMKLGGDGVERLVVKYGMLSIANTAAKSLGRAIEDMTDKVRSGEASFADLFDQAARGIPLVGGFYEMAKALAQVALDGNSSAEAIKRQTAEIEKQIDLVAKLINSHGKLGQAQRDQAKAVAVGLAGQNFGAAARAVFGTEEDSQATAARVRQQVRDGFKAQFDAIDKLKRENDLKIQNQLTGPAEGGDFFFDEGKLQDARKNAAKIEEMATQLRRDVSAAEDAALAKIGNGAFVQLAKLAGGEVTKGFDTAGAALERFIKNVPVANQVTERLVENFNKLAQSRSGNIGQFLGEQGTLKFDAGRGAISPDVFKALSDKSFFDQAARSVGSILQQYAPIAETIARLVDSNLGASGFANRLAAQLGSLVPGSIDFTPKKFQSSTLGLTDLGRRIQEGAASGGGGSPEAKKLDGIEKAAQAQLAAEREGNRILNKILNKNTAAVVK